MDRLGRIVAVWFAGCMIPGVALVAANAPLPGATIQPEQELWYRVGIGLILLALAAALAEVGLVIWSHRHLPIQAVIPASQPAVQEPEQLAKARTRLAELEAKEAREQRRNFGSALDGLAAEARGMRADYAEPNDSHLGQHGPADAWVRAQEWNDKIVRLLKRELPNEPRHLAFFSEAMDPMALADASWRVNIGVFLETKAKRLEKIARDLQGMPSY